jgi:hypothetical protein
MRKVPLNHQHRPRAVRRAFLRAVEMRIRQHQQRVSRKEEAGWYDRRLLTAGLHQDDHEEYGTRYTGRQARKSEVASSVAMLAGGSLGAPCGQGSSFLPIG